MKVLLIKMSSMGDIIHLFPALSDMQKYDPTIQFDWVTEEAFADLPALHPAVGRVIPVALRRWRKQLFSAEVLREVRQFWRELRQTEYDIIIDAQGLLKSAIIGKCASGMLTGESLPRERFAARLYQRKHFISVHHHAIYRLRALFASVFDVKPSLSRPDFAILTEKLPEYTEHKNYYVFLHSTTWATKHLPLDKWQELAKIAATEGRLVLLPWVSEQEYSRACAIKSYCKKASVSILPVVLPKLSLLMIISVLNNAEGVIAVDTGLGHIASALNIPTLSIYGPTSPDKTGAKGQHSYIQASAKPCAPCLGRNCIYTKENNFPCYDDYEPNMLWKTLQKTVAYANAQ